VNRRSACLRLVALAMLAVAPTRGQSQVKIYRIGYIQLATPQEQEQLTRAFEAGLRELGYVPGRNVVIEQRLAHGRQDRLPDLAADLVRLKVDVVVTGANPAIAAMQRATTSIPIVMTTSRDPVGSGFVASLSRPGGNITGFSSDPTPEVQSKRLELLKEALPAASRIGLLWNPLPPGAETYRKITESAAAQLGLTVQSVALRTRDEFEPAFAAMARDRIDALVVLPDPVFYTARAQIVGLVARHRFPAVFHVREFVELGGLMSYGGNLADQFRRSAVYVDKILKGAKPGLLPVEQQQKLELVVNAKAAKALGIKVAPALLTRADEVIE
jgi:putative tryptophan/tyrosine transport system substrate-binding protein